MKFILNIATCFLSFYILFIYLSISIFNLCICLFIYLSIYLFTYSIIYLFIYLLNYVFIYIFAYSYIFFISFIYEIKKLVFHFKQRDLVYLDLKIFDLYRMNNFLKWKKNDEKPNPNPAFQGFIFSQLKVKIMRKKYFKKKKKSEKTSSSIIIIKI